MSQNAAVRIRLSVLHARFDPKRVEFFEGQLLPELIRQCVGLDGRVDLRVYSELTPRGSLPGWLQTLEDGLDAAEMREWPNPLCHFEPTHLTFLPDDVVLGKNFVRGLLAAVEAQPNEVICGLPTHAYAAEAKKQGFAFYRTLDAFAAFAGTMTVEFAREHLAWREANIEPGVKLEGDQGVNVHLMQLGRGCLKTIPALVQHAMASESLDGSDTREGQPRVANLFDAETDLALADWTKPVVDVGRTTLGSHWRVLYDTRPASWDVELVYRHDRDKDMASIDSEEGRAFRLRQLAVSPKDKPSVLVAVPEYRGMVNECRVSLMNALKALQRAGIPAELRSFPGQSLVTRCRNILTHVFMTTKHNVLVQWDDDVECLDPDVLVKMLDKNKDVIGCAYPFRDGSGGVVVGPLPKKGGLASEYELAIEDETCSVRDLATGLLMVRRHVLVDLMQRHPELLCQIDGGGSEVKGAPHWALFDTAIASEGVGHRRRYLSEDWSFSRLCRAAGYDPRLYVPPILRHWGMRPSEGHVLVAYEIESPEAVYGEGSVAAIELRARMKAGAS